MVVISKILDFIFFISAIGFVGFGDGGNVIGAVICIGICTLIYQLYMKKEIANDYN